MKLSSRNSRQDKSSASGFAKKDTDRSTVSPTRKFRPGGGSFDFLMGAYEESRGASRRRIWAIVAGLSVLMLMGIFTGYQMMSRNMVQQDNDKVAAEYNQVAAEYQAKTGKAPQTRAQLAAQLRSQSQALKLASTSSVDVSWLVNELAKVIPPGGQVTAMTVKSWQDPAAAGASGRPSPSASSDKPVWEVSFTVDLNKQDVSTLEGNVRNLPFYQSQTSQTSYNATPGRAQTQMTVISKTPLSSPELQKLAQGGS